MTDKPKTILFDMDDTILEDDVNTEKAWKIACFRIRDSALGILPEDLYAAIRKTSSQYWSDRENHRIGRLNLVQTRRDVVMRAFTRLGLNNPPVACKLADIYTEEKENLITPLPGALKTLKVLKKEGYGLGLLTNGEADIQRRKINRFGLSFFFDHICIEGEFGVGKPDKLVFQSALTKLNANPEKTWMVGDDLVRDIDGAQKSGIYGIWVDWRKSGLSSDSIVKPDQIVNRISDLLS